MIVEYPQCPDYPCYENVIALPMNFFEYSISGQIVRRMKTSFLADTLLVVFYSVYFSANSASCHMHCIREDHAAYPCAVCITLRTVKDVDRVPAIIVKI